MAPSPLAMALDPAGSSSITIVSTHSRPAMARFRARSCSTVRAASVGTAAEAIVSTAAAANDHTAIRRRPTLSASAVTTTVTTTPRRTTANTSACCPLEPLPRSAEANVSTCVSTANRAPPTIECSAIAAISVDCRAFRRSGVDHHGRRPGAIPSRSARVASGR